MEGQQEQVIVTGTPVDAGNSKSVFGAINSPTPIWSKWIFRSVAILTTVASFWVAGTSLVPEVSKTEILLAFKVLDMLAFGFSKLFGVVPDEKVQ